jgi:hypothetical protein
MGAAVVNTLLSSINSIEPLKTVVTKIEMLACRKGRCCPPHALTQKNV